MVEERDQELGHQKAQQRLRRATDGRAHDAQRDERPLVARRPPEPAHDARGRGLVDLVDGRRRLDVVGFRGPGVRVGDGLGEDDVILRHGRDTRDARAAVVGRRHLRLDERLVRAALGHELVVRAALGHGALVEDADLVRAADRAEAVGYHKRRPRLRGRDAVERLLDDALGLGVEGGGRLVEDQDLRVANQCPRNRDALALAATQLHAAVADLGIKTVREAADEVVGVREPRRARALVASRAFAAEPAWECRVDGVRWRHHPHAIDAKFGAARYAMFSNIVPVNRTGSCATSPIFDRSVATSSVRASTPSTTTAPPETS